MNLDKPVILVIDDDKRLRDLLSKYLKTNNFIVLTAVTAEDAENLISKMAFDLIILDLMLPGKNGLEFLVEYRKHNQTPILMLTARSEPYERIAGLESGANDYLGKPFEPKELLLRITNLLARDSAYSKAIENNLIYFGNFCYDPKHNNLTNQNQPIILTTTEGELLRILIENNSNILSREQLAAKLGGINERSIDVQINRLRSKIEANPKQPVFLQAVWGKGYIFKIT